MNTATAVKLTPVYNDRKPLRCPHCNGRLFIQTDIVVYRFEKYLSCINCSREYDLTGKAVMR